VGSDADVSQRATPIVPETATDVKKSPTVFIVDNRPAVLNLLEAAVKRHDLPVQCYSSAAQFIADQDLNQVGCVLIDPLIAVQGDVVLRWLHASGRLLSAAATAREPVDYTRTYANQSRRAVSPRIAVRWVSLSGRSCRKIRRCSE
jgi:hypothetical protein